jgi:hypothetical protein
MSEEDRVPDQDISLGILHKVVLHLDQLGDFLGVQQQKNAQDSDLATRDDWQLYTSSAFGKSLAAICVKVPNLWVSLSVRLSSKVHMLHLPSCVLQAYVQPLCPTDPEHVKPVLQLYLAERVWNSVIAELSAQLAGPFRLLHKFLFEVQLKQKQPLTASVLKQCIARSYADLRLELLAHLDLYGQSNKGLLKALCVIWKQASRTEKCRLTTEIKAQVNGILASGLLTIRERQNGEYADIGRPTPFFKFVLNGLEYIHVDA